MSENNEVILPDKIGFDEMLELVHSTNLYDRTKTLGDCIRDEIEFVLKKVAEYRKAGSVTIKLNFGCGDRSEINVTADVTSQAPKGKVKQNIFYQDSKDGSLYTDMPNQTKIFALPPKETHQKGAIND